MSSVILLGDCVPHKKTNLCKKKKKSKVIFKFSLLISVLFVQSLSQVRLFVNPWTAARQSPMSFTISQSLLTFMSVEFLVLYNHLILFHPISFRLQSFSVSWSFPVSGLFWSCGQSIELQLQHLSFQWIFRVDFL